MNRAQWQRKKTEGNTAVSRMQTQKTGLLAALFVIGSLLVAKSAHADRAIVSGTPWFDDQGNQMNAHGAGVFQVGTTYYMVGEVRTLINVSTGSLDETNYAGVACYSSQDLMKWSRVGGAGALALGLDNTSAGIAGGLDGSGIIERPKVLYNSSTRQYVMYFHEWKPGHHAGYATSSSPCSGYTYQGDVQKISPLGSGPVIVHDIGVFRDGTDGYLLTTNGDIFHLSNNNYYSADAALSVQPFALPGSYESPVMFKSGSTYFYLTSAQTGWLSNENQYSTATSMSGPWAAKAPIVSSPSGTLTWDSQVTAVIPVTGTGGTTYIYAGDRWAQDFLTTSTYIWLPLTVSGTTVSIPTYHPSWRPIVSTGLWEDVADNGLMVNNTVTGTGTDQFNYTGWANSGACPAGTNCLNSDFQYTTTANDLAQMVWTGTQIKFYTSRQAIDGIVGFTECDAAGANCGPEILTDSYSFGDKTSNPLFVGHVQAAGTYTLKVRNTGSKQVAATNYRSSADKVSISLLANPDFETGHFTGWNSYVSGAGAANAVSTRNTHSGTYKGYISLNGATAGMWGLVTQVVTGLTNGNHTVKAWVYHNGGGIPTWAFMKLADYNGTSTVSANVPINASGYSQLSLTANVTNATNGANGSLKISFYEEAPAVSASYFLRFDDVTIQ